MSFKNKKGKTTTWRLGMIRNLATHLIVHERIETVKSRAKYLQEEIESLVTIAKGENKVVSTRRLQAYLRDVQVNDKMDVVTKLQVLAAKYKNRNGGYTRVLNLANRKGDNSEMALIEFVK